jgi:RimJ/RimL family protein N-acetyltransferase
MELETERLLLRPLHRTDVEAWIAFLSDREALRLVHFPEPHDRQRAEELLERTVARADGDVAMYTVTVRDGRDTVGFVGYSPRSMEWGQERELGWLLLPQFHGRGYATEAAAAIRGLVPGRVISLIRVENEPSINVARKLGMRLERSIEFAGFETYVYVSDAA